MTEHINHWRDDLSNEAYHAIKEYQSSSQLKIMATETPLDYIDTINNGSKVVTSKDMKLSTHAHHMVLEGEDFIKRYVVKPKFDRRYTDEKKEEENWDKANKGKVAVTEADLIELQGMYEGLHRNEQAVALLKDNLFERSGFYKDPETGKLLRIRYDSYCPESRMLIDLKAMRDVRYEAFEREILNRRYDFSMAMYGEGIQEIDGIGPITFWFIALLKTRPYHCAVYPIKQSMIERGREDYYKALRDIKKYEGLGVWPGLSENMKPIGYPDWYERKLVREAEGVQNE